ncbi:MAG: AsmA family protein, partial [Syntrophaceae bacterium]
MKLKLIPTLAGAVLFLLVITVYVIFASYDYNTLKPEISRAFQDATGKGLTLGGDISLKIGLTPTLVVRDVTIQNAPWGSQPELARIKRLEIKVRFFPLLAHRVDLIRAILIEPELLLETDTSGKSNLAIDAPVKDRTAKKKTDTGGWGLSRITFEEMRIENGRVTYTNPESEKRYTATVPVFTAGSTGPFGGPIRIGGKVAYNEESFEITGTVGSLATFADPALAWPVSLKLSRGDAVLTLDGSINDPLARRGLRFYFSLKSRDPAGLSGLSGLAKLPRLKGPLDISGRIIDTGKDSYSISDLKIIEGDNDLGGSVDL